MVKYPPAKAGDMGLIPGWGRSPGRGNGKPLQYSCLQNSVDRASWQATVHGLQRVRYDLVAEHGSTQYTSIRMIRLFLTL